MKDNTYDLKTGREQIITSRLDLSVAELKEEAELDRVDFETLLEEIRAS